MSKTEHSGYEEVDLSRLKRTRMTDLKRKVEQAAFARPVEAGKSLDEFVESLPDILAARDLRRFAHIVASAAHDGKAVIIMFGGHVIKTGLAPLLIDWIKRGIITSLATNGSSAIHDSEIALFGRTSEDVAEGLADGSFGMSSDTADFINNAITASEETELGFGEAIGRAVRDSDAPYKDLSLFCCAYESRIPLTVHVALGTDIIHQHPSANGSAIGRASMKDFRIFAREVGRLDEGGVVMNIGSAVIMPEVFLKALTVARNLGYPAHGFATANFDMNVHYRPVQNVLNRPTLTGGQKFNFIGHHEIMIPLLFAIVNTEMERLKDE